MAADVGTGNEVLTQIASVLTDVDDGVRVLDHAAP